MQNSMEIMQTDLRVWGVNVAAHLKLITAYKAWNDLEYCNGWESTSLPCLKAFLQVSLGVLLLPIQNRCTDKSSEWLLIGYLLLLIFQNGIQSQKVAQNKMLQNFVKVSLKYSEVN